MRARTRTEHASAVSGWDIERADGWYVAVPQSPSIHKVFDAPTLRALVHKIELWARCAGAQASRS